MIYVGGADFTAIGPLTGFNRFPANSPIRRDCFNIVITNDTIYEMDEFFTLVLRQDPFPPTSSSIWIRTDNTTITILDESGMYRPSLLSKGDVPLTLHGIGVAIVVLSPS